jgi:type I restriction enzyme S subunit
MHAINSPQFRADVESLQSGSTRKRISRKNLEKIYLPVPPLPEQERIVAKIEELFTQLDAGIAALHRVKAEVKRYKASVLKAAVEGKLGIQNDEGRTQDDGQLPAGWTEVEFKEIITSLKNGYFYGRPSSEPIGIPILRISAVRPMSVSYSDLRYVPELKEEDVENYFLSKGDLLFTRYNGNLDLVGACGLVREGSQRVIYPDKLIRVRVQNEIAMPEYLEIYFSTIAARKLIESRVKSTAGQHGISGGDIKSLSVILPPLEEQRRIVAEVERRLSLAAGVESTLAASLSRAGRLRQSVLKSAFEGKLLS